MAKNIVTLNLDNTDYSIRPYGTCSTAATTAAKTVSITEFTLCVGATVLVKFDNTNSATSPTLNINSTGAKPIKWKGASNDFLDANVYYEFMYDGTNWVVLGEADTKVTSVDNHYTPAENTVSQLSAEASGATAEWEMDVVKGVTIKRDAKGHVTGVDVMSGKIPANPNTDTKVTSVDNHYTPDENTAAQLSADATGGNAEWDMSVVKGVTIKRDAKGHVTGVSVTSGKIPANPNVDTDTKNTAGATNNASKMYLIGALSQDANPQTYSNSNVYATNGELTATKFNGGLNGISATSVNNCNGDKLLKYFTLSGCTATEATNNKRYAGTADSYGFPVSSNANGLLWLGNHSTNYGHQLGFSSDGKIYHRSITNGSFPTTANGGSWKTIAFTSDIPSIPGVATASSDGLMSAADKSILDGIEPGANKYEHPKAGKNVGSFGISTNVTIDHGETLIIPYITVDSDGHVTAASNVSITFPNQYVLPVATGNILGGINIGYSENNKKYAVKLDDNNKAYVEVPWETYSNATTSKAGLMSTTDKFKLDNIVAATNEEIDNLF